MTEKEMGKLEEQGDNLEGKSGKTARPSWMKMKKEELENEIVKLAKEGRSSAEIGLILRDKHAVPKTKLFGDKIEKVLRRKGVAYKSEKAIIEERIANLRIHIDKHKSDYPASRALTKKLWRVRGISQRS